MLPIWGPVFPMRCVRRRLALHAATKIGAVERSAEMAGVQVTLIEDGVFGSATEGSVKHYQQNENPAVDGIVGKPTWKSLFVQVAAAVGTALTAFAGRSRVTIGTSSTSRLRRAVQSASVGPTRRQAAASRRASRSRCGLAGSCHPPDRRRHRSAPGSPFRSRESQRTRRCACP